MTPPKKEFPPVRACIFDLDGLLLKTEDIYTLCANSILAKYGRPELPWSIKAKIMGMPGSRNGDVFHEWAQLPISREQYGRELLEQQQIYFADCKPPPGAMKLLTELAKAHDIAGKKIYVALASGCTKCTYDLKTRGSESKRLIDLIPERHRVLGEDSRLEKSRVKPAPDIFLVALETINSNLDAEEEKIKPEQCLVFEDGVMGVESGRRAGMRVVWVPHPGLVAEYEGREDEVLAGRARIADIGNEEQLGGLADGWGEKLDSLEAFRYEKYGILID